jgi:hypothetical protein
MERLPLLLSALPWVALWLVAAVFAALRWNRHPVASLLVVVSAALHVVTSVASSLLPFTLTQRTMTERMIVSSALGVIGLVASGCLVAAVFIGRPAVDLPRA